MNTENGVRVWDPLVRVFHWSLVAAFVISYLSGDDFETVHVWSGYFIAGLLVIRILWGVVGTRHARFRDFLYRPSVTVDYARRMLTGSHPRYLGHNPLGGWMALALIITLSGVVLSGMATLGAEEGEGPMAFLAADAGGPGVVMADEPGEHGEGEEHEDEAGEVFEELHEILVNLSLLLIGLHILGVLTESLMHRENLARAMVTGKKRSNDESE